MPLYPLLHERTRVSVTGLSGSRLASADRRVEELPLQRPAAAPGSSG
ncbi:hypothetical protein [Bosea sp. 2RAB26]